MKMSVFFIAVVCGLVAGQAVIPGTEKNPCDAERARLQSTGHTAPGTSLPSCTANGWYNYQQTHASTGFSWCVDPQNGHEIEGTRVPPGSSPTCGKCLIDRASALPAAGVVGAFVPQCDSQGNFEVQQFHGSTGYSWCVDPDTGAEVPGTKKPPGSSTKCSLCLIKRAMVEKMPGAFVPKCDSRGNFEVLQVHGSTGSSFCVDPETGNEISGTKVGPGSTAKCPKCFTERATSLSASNAPGSSTAPSCDALGHYNVQQNNPSTGYSWCVDPETGVEIAGTKVGPGSTVICPNCLVNKAGYMDLASPQPPGSPQPPKCDTQGYYEFEQFNPSTGYKWCVNPETGEELTGSRVAPGGTIACPKCLKEKILASPKDPPPPGTYVPQCETNGKYKVEQFHPSTGYRWCVDATTGIERPGSRIPPGQQRPGGHC